jgi:hypothetical protein
MTTSASKEAKNLVVRVHNEDSGDVIELPAGPGTPVSTLIDRLYDKFGLTPQTGDRLRCEGGSDVTPHADMHLGDYAAQHCSDLVWLFAGAQGGA